MALIKRPIFQYAYFVGDIDAAVRKWVDLFGAGPFFVVRHHRSEGYFRYRGTETQADVSYAFAYCGPVQIQLIAQHDDQPSIYREMYAAGREGFHHVGILSAEFERDKAELAAQGLDLAIEMWSGADVVYFDARKEIGGFVEIHGASPVIADLFAVWKNAHDTWDGVTRPLRETNDPDVQRVLARM